MYRDQSDELARGGSPDRFGYQWEKYSGLDADYEEQFRRWTPHFAPGDWKGKRFLDIGCGMGRNLVQSEYFRLLERFTSTHLRSLVFDQLHSRIASYWRREKSNH